VVLRTRTNQILIFYLFPYTGYIYKYILYIIHIFHVLIHVAGNRRYSAHHLTAITRLHISYVSLPHIFRMNHHLSILSFRFCLCHVPGHEMKLNKLTHKRRSVTTTRGGSLDVTYRYGSCSQCHLVP
jgi:hypothetical protein